MMREEFQPLKKKLNFLEFDFREKKVYLFRDHSVAIKCLKKAFDEKTIKKDNFLVHIDNHSDLQYVEKNLEKSKKIVDLNDEELDDFIQGLRSDNSEFIIPLFYSGLIRDCISIHREEGSFNEKKTEGRLGGDSEHILFDKDGKGHKVFLGGSSVRELFHTHGGLLGDKIQHNDIISEYNSKKVILDIDLDYFTYSEGKRFAQNRRDIIEQINSDSFQNLINKSSIILIALEPKCCGGNEDCLEILNIFEEAIFSDYNLNIYDKIKAEFFNHEN
jgi:hypothetical protein